MSIDETRGRIAEAGEARNRQSEAARQLELFGGLLSVLPGTDTQEGIRLALEQIGSHLDMGRASLYEDDPAHRTARAVGQWQAGGVSPGAPALEYQRDIPEAAHALERRSVCALDEELPSTGSAEWCRAHGVSALAAFGVHTGAKRYGCLLFERCGDGQVWTEDDLRLLRAAAALVAVLVEQGERRQSLKARRAAVETVLDHIPTYVYVADPQTMEIVFANRTFRREFPVGPGEESVETLQGRVAEYAAAHPGLADPLRETGALYFEVELAESCRWIGVQCGEINWMDGRRMLLLSGQDISDQRRQEEYIRRIAYMDHLTGLPNRYRCEIDLEETVAAARQAGKTGYILFVDLDDFKIVNDGYGHDYGDALLIEFANYLSGSCLEGDKVFRLGGDEFVLLITPANAAAIHSVVAGLIQRARKPWRVIDKDFACTVSLGIVAFPDGDMGAREITKNADVAMYEAKRAGKNSFVFYTADLHSHSMERAEAERLLRKGMEEDFRGFSLHYQPYVELDKPGAMGAEALLRWAGPDGADIPPAEFIPLAEYLGLIVELGDFVLQNACRTLREINDAGLPRFAVSVNLSARQLRQQDILQRVERAVALAGADPRNLMLEIAEHAALEDAPRTRILCGELRKMGIRVVLDDFGSGTASVGNLRDMPLDVVKFDRALLGRVGQDRSASPLIRLVTDFSHAMGKRVCVKGVETKSQLDYCRYVGADEVQGFHYYRPLPRDALLGSLFAPDKKESR